MDPTFELGVPGDLGAKCLLINTECTRATGECFAAFMRSHIDVRATGRSLEPQYSSVAKMRHALNLYTSVTRRLICMKIPLIDR